MVWYLRTSWSLNRIVNLKLLLRVILNNFMSCRVTYLWRISIIMCLREKYLMRTFCRVYPPQRQSFCNIILVISHFAKVNKNYEEFSIFQILIPFMNLQNALMKLVCHFQMCGKIVNQSRSEVKLVYYLFLRCYLLKFSCCWRSRDSMLITSSWFNFLCCLQRIAPKHNTYAQVCQSFCHLWYT